MNNTYNSRRRRGRRNRNNNINFNQRRGAVDPLMRNNIRINGREAKSTLFGFSKVVNLEYNDPDSQRSSGANWLVWSYKLNDVYDPDPLLLTGGITGYSEMVRFFDRWTVEDVDVRCQFSNWESGQIESIGYVIGPSNLVGTLASRSDAVDALERPGSIKRPMNLSEKGGMDRSQFSFRIKPATALGNTALYNGSLNYSGGTSSSPPIPLFVNFVVIGVASLTLANGLFVTTTLNYKTRFFELTPGLLGSVYEARFTLLFVEHQEELRGKTRVEQHVLRKAFLERVKALQDYHKVLKL